MLILVGIVEAWTLSGAYKCCSTTQSMSTRGAQPSISHQSNTAQQMLLFPAKEGMRLQEVAASFRRGNTGIAADQAGAGAHNSTGALQRYALNVAEA